MTDVMSSRRGIRRSVLLVRSPSGRRTRRTGTSASCGPAAASGWYWTLNAGTSRQRRPSTTSSLRHTWLTVARPNGVSNSPVARGVDGEAVVVRRDRHAAGRQVLHRLVDAAVPVAQLVGAEARAPGRAPGCRSRCRRPACRSARNSLMRSTARSAVAGSPGPLEKNTPSGRQRADLVRRRWSPAPRGPPCRAGPSGAGVIDLMPRSTAATVKRRSPTAGTTYGVRRGDVAGEVRADHAGARLHQRQQVLGGALGVGSAEDPDPHGSPLAQVPGQGAGVDAADAHDALLGELVRRGCGWPASSRRCGRGRARRTRRPRCARTRHPRRSPRCCRCAEPS